MSIKELELESYLKKELEKTKKQKKVLESIDSLPSFSVNGFSNFFTASILELKFEYNRQILIVNDEKIYLSLFERSTNFELLPKDENLFLFGSHLKMDMNFVIDPTLKVELILIYFNNEKQIKSKKINPKQSKNILIENPDNAKSFRIAIRIEGSGNFRIDELTVEQKISKENSVITSQPITIENSNLKKQSNLESFKKNISNNKYFRKVNKNGLKIASILDEFSQECFKYDCDLKAITKESWLREIEEFQPDFLLVESCWQGNSSMWAYEVANLHKNQHRKELRKLTDYCKNNGIKTVFWDKEGVENFDFFKEASSYFEYIFTADENNIENFKKYVGHDNVFVLAFAAQPQIHNPINKNRHYLGEIAFGGTYYGNKHEERKKDIENLIKPSLNFGVDIFDRYFGIDPKKVPNNQWPEEYKNNIIGNLKYNEMIEAYKNYDIFFTVNSVQNSKYMFARRVFEILASRSMVISGPSVGVKEFFGDIVPISNNPTYTTQLLKIYTKNKIVREKLVREGARLVQTKHTYKNRLQEICNKIGIQKNILLKPKVSIISSTQREEFMDNLYENINNQTYEQLEIIIILNKNEMDIKKWENKFSDIKIPFKIIKIDENVSLGNCLNEAINLSTGEIVAKFDDDDYYGPNYILDMILSMEYSNAGIVGKSSHYIYLESQNLLLLKTMGAGEERYSDFVAGATLVFKKEIINKIGGFGDKNRGEDSDFLKRAKEAGYLIYSNDSYNFCAYRRSDRSSHTWQVTEEELLRNSQSHSYTTDYKTPISL
ncbi:glycosyltransferase [Ureibacillus sp. 179-F W5.1 NHS]|uniref:glycosyltransferase family protein n=1 Tax=Ureibacillus sp. 179-F W5.1 NHS TaxID=3374297 RepID=UPI00387A3E5F